MSKYFILFKITFFIVFLMFPFLTSIAQTKGFGIKAGANISSFSSEDSEGVSTKGSVYGYQVGGHINLSFHRFIIQPGLTYISKGGYQIYINDSPAQPSDFQAKYYPKYLEIPLNILYDIKTGKRSLSFGGGPYFAYAIGGSEEGNGVLFGRSYSNAISDINFGEDRGSSLSTLDYGINAVIDLRIANNVGLNLNYSHGMSNISPGNTRNNGFVTDVNNRTWGISAVYSFK